MDQKHDKDQNISRRKALKTLATAGAAVIAGTALGGVPGLAPANASSVTESVYGDEPSAGCDCEVIVTTIAELRANTAPSADVIYFVTDAGQEGYFRYVASDTSTLDNTGTVLVSSLGARFTGSWKMGSSMSNGSAPKETAFPAERPEPTIRRQSRRQSRLWESGKPCFSRKATIERHR